MTSPNFRTADAHSPTRQIGTTIAGISDVPASHPPRRSAPRRAIQRPIRSTSIRLPGDADGATAKTIQVMMAAATGKEGARNPQIRELATKITAGVQSRDKRGEIDAVRAWLRAHIKFRGEFGETVQTPTTTVRLRAGDCDDFATLAAALLLSLGYEVRFVTIAADPGAPHQFSHVYLEARAASAGEWVAIDATEDRPLGWRPEKYSRIHAWPALGDSTSQIVENLATPIANAAAQRIAFGSRDFAVGGTYGQGGSLSGILLGAVGVAGLFALFNRGRR